MPKFLHIHALDLEAADEALCALVDELRYVRRGDHSGLEVEPALWSPREGPPVPINADWRGRIQVGKAGVDGLITVDF